MGGSTAGHGKLTFRILGVLFRFYRRLEVRRSKKPEKRRKKIAGIAYGGDGKNGRGASNGNWGHHIKRVRGRQTSKSLETLQNVL